MVVKIGDRKVGPGNPCFIIAELSANHLHNYDLVIKLIDKVADSGADAFKIQTLTADTMTINCDNDYFKIDADSDWDGRTLYDLYSETPLPYEWHDAIFKKCRERNLICFSTPYDISATKFLQKFDPPAYKIASFEIVDIPFIEYVASLGKPILLSTGIANLNNINEAIDAIRAQGNDKIILLKCTSAYPAPYEEINLLTMANMSETFNCVTGISDHTLGIETSIASIVLNGSVIEKHVTLSRDLGGPDKSFSLNPKELKDLVSSVRNTENILGEVSYDLTKKAAKSLIFARSLFFVNDLDENQVITHFDIRSIRPGYGISPKYYNKVIGMRTRSKIKKGTPCSWDLLSQ